MYLIHRFVPNPRLILFLGLSMLGNSVQAFQPEVGKPLADFTLPRIDNGAPISLSGYRGKKTLLIMFASW